MYIAPIAHIANSVSRGAAYVMQNLTVFLLAATGILAIGIIVMALPSWQPRSNASQDSVPKNAQRAQRGAAAPLSPAPSTQPADSSTRGAPANEAALAPPRIPAPSAESEPQHSKAAVGRRVDGRRLTVKRDALSTQTARSFGPKGHGGATSLFSERSSLNLPGILTPDPSPPTEIASFTVVSGVRLAAVPSISFAVPASAGLNLDSVTSLPGDEYLEGLQQPIVWNYWLDAAGAPDALPHPERAPLSMGSTAHLRFRLSLLDLSKLFDGIGKLQSARELAQAIEQDVKNDADVLKLTVLVSPLNEQGVRVASGSRAISIDVDLRVVRRALEHPELVAKPGNFALETVLAQTTVAQFGLDVVLLTKGPHQIALAMTDANTGNFLQTMVATVNTGVDWPESLQLSGSGQSLFAAGSPPTDFTLWLSGKKTADAQGNNDVQVHLLARDSRTGKFDDLYWKADSNLKGLLDQRETFLGIQGRAQTGSALKEAGVQFSRMIFDPLPDNGPEQSESTAKQILNAQRARELIVAASRYAVGAPPPTMVVQITDSSLQGNFESQMLPIGALSITPDTGEEPIFFGERFALALTLPKQQPAKSEACAPNWFMAVPTADVETSGALYDALTDLAPMRNRWAQDQWRPQPSSMQDLKQWISSGSSARDPDNVVLAYLGHHSLGSLFLREDAASLGAGIVTRAFGRSSIAILNACTSASREISDGTWIGRLARRNVAATIATTSEIDGHLAAAYLDCLSTVLKGEDLTVGQAHALATQCLWSPASGKRWDRDYDFSGAALKYLLVGNPYQRICAPSTKQVKQ